MHSHYLSQHPPLGHGPNSHTPPMSDREMWLADYIVGRVLYVLKQWKAEEGKELLEHLRTALDRAASVIRQHGESRRQDRQSAATSTLAELERLASLAQADLKALERE